MAEKYKRGIQRLYYRSSSFKEEVEVTMDILDPSLVWFSGFQFIEVGKGVYFLDFNFSMLGSYYAILYEDGAKKTSTSYYVFEDDFVLPTPMGKGPSVINN